LRSIRPMPFALRLTIPCGPQKNHPLQRLEVLSWWNHTIQP
jgi:hypothetical protein